MIKRILLLLTIFVMISSSAYALDYNQSLTPEVKRAISKYKVGNYTGCIQEMDNFINNMNNEK